MKKLLALFVVVLGFSAITFALSPVGVTTTATSSATIVAPLAIANAGDMNFGNLSVNATAGTVVLTPAGVRTVTGGVTVVAGTPGTVTAAKFDVSGTPAYSYAISLPTAAITLTSGGNTMTVSTFTSNPTTTGTLDGSGLQTVNVGATLNVGGTQAAGLYISTPFNVTVDYN